MPLAVCIVRCICPLKVLLQLRGRSSRYGCRSSRLSATLATVCRACDKGASEIALPNRTFGIDFYAARLSVLGCPHRSAITTRGWIEPSPRRCAPVLFAHRCSNRPRRPVSGEGIDAHRSQAGPQLPAAGRTLTRAVLYLEVHHPTGPQFHDKPRKGTRNGPPTQYATATIPV